MAEPSADNPTLSGARARRWFAAWRSLGERPLRVLSWLFLIVAVGLVAVGQLTEDLADSDPLQLLSPASAIRRWTIIFAVLYMLVISRVVDGLVERSLRALEPILKAHGNRPKHYAHRMRRPGILVDGVLLGFSALAVTALFVAIGSSLPIDDPVTNQPLHLPSSSAGAILVLAQFAVVGWAVVSLVYSTIRRAWALGQLSREPLEVDVFDTTKLLPFGNIALATALAPAGIIVILLVGFGRPSALLSWSVLLLATSASLLALLLPLRGIHRQMAETKQHALSGINAGIRKVYERLNGASKLSAGEAAGLSNETATLIALRKTVSEMTTWPFQDTLAFGRAVLIASAPLIYTIISELIKVFWINPLAG